MKLSRNNDKEEAEDNDEITNEIDRYLLIKHDNATMSSIRDNPLIWWQNSNAIRFHQLYNLQRLAIYYHSQKASESPVEWLFSKGGYYFIGKKNYNLLDRKTDAIFKIHGHLRQQQSEQMNQEKE